MGETNCLASYFLDFNILNVGTTSVFIMFLTVNSIVLSMLTSVYVVVKGTLE